MKSFQSTVNVGVSPSSAGEKWLLNAVYSKILWKICCALYNSNHENKLELMRVSLPLGMSSLGASVAWVFVGAARIKEYAKSDLASAADVAKLKNAP